MADDSPSKLPLLLEDLWRVLILEEVCVGRLDASEPAAVSGRLTTLPGVVAARGLLAFISLGVDADVVVLVSDVLVEFDFEVGCWLGLVLLLPLEGALLFGALVLKACCCAT